MASLQLITGATTLDIASGCTCIAICKPRMQKKLEHTTPKAWRRQLVREMCLPGSAQPQRRPGAWGRSFPPLLQIPPPQQPRCSGPQPPSLRAPRRHRRLSVMSSCPVKTRHLFSVVPLSVLRFAHTLPSVGPSVLSCHGTPFHEPREVLLRRP